MIFQYGWKPFLIQRILIGFEVILEMNLLDMSIHKGWFHTRLQAKPKKNIQFEEVNLAKFIKKFNVLQLEYFSTGP